MRSGKSGITRPDHTWKSEEKRRYQLIALRSSGRPTEGGLFFMWVEMLQIMGVAR